MKVLLIYPEYPATFWSFKHALKFINKKASLPPLGLLTVSALLPASWEKKLADLNVANLKSIDLEWADMVFISGMIVQKESALEVIDRAKALGKFVVAGGPLFTSNYKDFANVDCFVLNEGEETIPLFLKGLEEGNIEHIYTSTNKPDLLKSPVPDWSLINKKDYATLSMQVSRGCPFSCDFCDIIIMNGRQPRVKTTEQVRNELDALYNIGWRGSLFIVDDNFIGNKKKVKQILREIISWMEEKKKPFTLFTEAPITLADDRELMELMRKANFCSVFIGIETPEEDGLIGCGKLQNTNKDLLSKVRILQRNGFEVQAGFIIGFDTDTANTFDSIIKFIQESGIVTAMVGLLHALPETKLYKRLEQEGRLVSKASGNNTDFTMNFVPKMDADTLYEGYSKVQNTIFSSKYFYKRVINYLKAYKRSSSGKSFSYKDQVNAFLKSIWKLGIREKEKRYFWQMLLWTAFRKPLLLPDAVTQAIYGYHFKLVLLNRKK